MVALTQRDLPYLVLTYDPNLQAYRTDRLANVEPVCPEAGPATSLRPGLLRAAADDRARRAAVRRQRRRRRRRPRSALGGGRRRSAAAFFVIAVDGAAARARAAGARGMRRACVSGRWLAGKVARGAADAALRPRLQLLPVPGHGRPDRRSSPACRGATPQEIEQLRADYGLDKPLLGQFADYVGDTVAARPRDQPAQRRAGLGRDQGRAPVDAAAGRDGHAAGDADRHAGWG